MKKIGTDFQGWSNKAQTLKEILITLGFSEDSDGYIKMKSDDKLLSCYPKVLNDDGMGYGVNPTYIIEANKQIYADSDLKEDVFNVFSEPIEEKVENFEK